MTVRKVSIAFNSHCHLLAVEPARQLAAATRGCPAMVSIAPSISNSISNDKHHPAIQTTCAFPALHTR